jgi:hypothetical protein
MLDTCGQNPKNNQFPENLLLRHPRMFPASEMRGRGQSRIHPLIFYFLCLDTKKQKSRAYKKLGIIKSIPSAKNI